MKTSFDADVIVVGCGPVGCGLAILLARQGLSVRVLDRSTAVYDLPRAVFLDGETIRAFQRVGLGDEVAALLQPWRPGDSAVFTNSRHEPYFGLDLPEVGLNGWRDGAFFDQPEFEGRLRELMAAEPLVTSSFGHEVTDLGQDESSAWVEATDLAGNASRRFTSRWIVACDGASSFVRRRLGIAWRSLGYDQDWLVVDVVVPELDRLPGVTMQVCDPARLITYICGKDPYRRWEFRLLPGETREELSRPEVVRGLVEQWVPAGSYELRRAVVYQFHAATAGRWREGRIFLAGDAAHQTPPFLGQGLNAGFRDASNLAWKMPLVARGQAPDSLLDSYAAERDAHAHELVDWAVAVGRLMEALADGEAGRASGPPPDDLMRSGYGQGRTAPPLRDGLVVAAQVSDLGVTGYLFAQPFVTASDGRERRFDDILGPGFAVVGRDAASLAMERENAAWLESIGARLVDLSAWTVVRGHADRLFGAHAAAVVRPDRYVHGVVDADHSLDDLVRILRAQWNGSGRAAAGAGDAAGAGAAQASNGGGTAAATNGGTR